MNIITISRQVGSYGDLIAAIVARRMGLELVGRQEVHEVALRTDPDYSDACAVYENEHGPGFFERIFFDRPSYTSLFEALTYEKAAGGNVVLVGRGAQIVLQEVPGVFHARVVAPFDVRVKRITERYGFQPELAEEFVRKYDRERSNLIRAVFDKDASDWSLYDLVINTSRYSAAAAAEILIKAAESMETALDPDQSRIRLQTLAFSKRVEAMLRKTLTSAIARHVEVEVEQEGVVRLAGRITDKVSKEKAAELVIGYPGVSAVRNDVMVTDFAFGV